jgi:hypothetical protein
LRRFGLIPSHKRFHGTFKIFYLEFRSRGRSPTASRSAARAAPLKLPAMNSGDAEHSDDDAGSSVDPHTSNATNKSWKEIEDLYSSHSESRVPATPEKEFEEADGQSDGSDLHTPAQSSKPRRLPSLSPVKRRHSIAPDSDSDGLDCDSLFESLTKKADFLQKCRIFIHFVLVLKLKV